MFSIRQAERIRNREQVKCRKTFGRIRARSWPLLTETETDGSEFRGTVLVDGQAMRGLFDTGCQRVIVHPRVIERLREAGHKKIVFPVSLRAVLANGETETVDGTAWIRVEYKGYSLTCKAVVMKTGADGPDVLVGNQFLRPAKMSFDWVMMKATPTEQGEFVQDGALIKHQFVPAAAEDEDGLQLIEIRSNVLVEVPAIAAGHQVDHFVDNGCRIIAAKSEDTGHALPEIVGRSKMLSSKRVAAADRQRHEPLSKAKIKVKQRERQCRTMSAKGLIVDEVNDKNMKLPQEADDDFPPVNISPHLTKDERRQIVDLVSEFVDIFYQAGGEIGCLKDFKAKLDTGQHAPIRKNYYEQPVKHLTDLLGIIKDLDEKGITVKNIGSWGAPVLVVSSHGKARMVVDFRGLNAILADHPCPLPQIKGLFMEFADSQFWSTLDMAQGYYQIRLEEDSQACTGIVFKWGTRMFTRLPMGVRSGPGIFMEAANKIIEQIPLTDSGLRRVFAYLDDIACCGKTFDEARNYVRHLFEKIRDSGFKLSPAKVYLLYDEISFLGHRVGRGGIRMSPDRVEAIINLQEPNTEAKMRSFIGFVQQVAGFIPFCAEMIRPLSQTLRKANARSDKKIILGPEQKAAIKKIIEIITKDGGPVLAVYDRNADFDLHVDASNYAIGALIFQVKEGTKRLLAVHSRQLKDYELHCTTTEKEAMAIAAAVSQFRIYIYGISGSITVYTDHCGLCWLHLCRDLNAKLCRWSIALSQFRLKIIHVRGADNTDADHLSRYVYEPLQEEPGEEFMAGSADLKRQFDEQTLRDRQQIAKDQNSERLLQDEEPMFKKAKGILQTGKEQEWKKFVMVDGLLYRKSFKRSQNRVYDALCVGCKSLQQDLIQETHAKAHSGINKIYNLLSVRFFWPNMFKDVAARIKACHECQLAKADHQPTMGFFQFRFIPKNVAEVWSVDAMGPFPRSVGGQEHVLVAVCNLSRYTVASAVSNITAASVIRFMDEKVFQIYGIPIAVQSDQGTNFTSDEFQAFLKTNKVIHLRSAPYHSQGSALVERKNADIKDALLTKTRKIKEWSKLLPLIVYEINTTICMTVKTSPFVLMFMREPRLSIDQDMPERRSTVMTGEDFMQAAQAFRDQARSMYKKEQEKWSVRQNIGRREVTFKKGDLVALRAGKVKGKLGLRYTGPHVVINRFGNDYVIESGCPRKKIKTANVARLKAYQDLAELNQRQEEERAERPEQAQVADQVDCEATNMTHLSGNMRSKRRIKLTEKGQAAILGDRLRAE